MNPIAVRFIARGRVRLGARRGVVVLQWCAAETRGGGRGQKFSKMLSPEAVELHRGAYQKFRMDRNTSLGIGASPGERSEVSEEEIPSDFLVLSILGIHSGWRGARIRKVLVVMFPRKLVFFVELR